MSLRLKIMCALLVTGLLSVSLMWAVAHDRLMTRFGDLRLVSSSRNFREDVAAYWHTYGSWDEGMSQEPFGRFVRRRRMGMGPPPEGILSAPGENPPPFRFLLISPEGRAFNAVPPYKPGESVKAEDRRGAIPVEVDGRVVAYASPAGMANFSDTERGYLEATQTSLVYGIGAATALAVILGIVLSSGLIRPLRRLTKAIQGMHDGAVRQRVEVGRRDEVGLLAEAFNMMSERLAEQAEQLREMALRDSLTGLFNRRHFDLTVGQICDQATRYSHPLTVVVGDLDHFKQVNDRFSHAVGDTVLREIAGLLSGHLRASDVVARYGGEEFVIAFPHTTLAEAAMLCERLRQLIEAHSWEGIASGLTVTMSMGACDDITLGSAEAMLKAADAHLYEAKEAGRNRIRCRLPQPAE